MTNADRIRAMTDEELLDTMATEICILTGNEQYVGGDFCGDCKQCLWEWLREEVAESGIGGLTMAEIIWGIDMGNSTTSWTPIKHRCKNGTMCELATEFGYCMVTGCVKREEGDNGN